MLPITNAYRQAKYYNLSLIPLAVLRGRTFGCFISPIHDDRDIVSKLLEIPNLLASPKSVIVARNYPDYIFWRHIF